MTMCAWRPDRAQCRRYIVTRPEVRSHLGRPVSFGTLTRSGSGPSEVSSVLYRRPYSGGCPRETCRDSSSQTRPSLDDTSPVYCKLKENQRDIMSTFRQWTQTQTAVSTFTRVCTMRPLKGCLWSCVRHVSLRGTRSDDHGTTSLGITVSTSFRGFL